MVFPSYFLSTASRSYRSISYKWFLFIVGFIIFLSNRCLISNVFCILSLDRKIEANNAMACSSEANKRAGKIEKSLEQAVTKDSIFRAINRACLFLF